MLHLIRAYKNQHETLFTYFLNLRGCTRRGHGLKGAGNYWVPGLCTLLLDLQWTIQQFHLPGPSRYPVENESKKLTLEVTNNKLL